LVNGNVKSRSIVVEDKIVMVNGCFDLLHVGHVKFLEEAKSKGTYLVVGLNADSVILGAKGRCVRPLKERQIMLEALDCVDEVQVFNEPTAVALLEAVRPAVYVTGDEYRGRSPEVAYALQAGMQIHYVERYGKWSTTNEIKRVVG
jgi:rfaE bifunctional protein nucleotidyltransferase chain/domain